MNSPYLTLTDADHGGLFEVRPDHDLAFFNALKLDHACKLRRQQEEAADREEAAKANTHARRKTDGGA